MCLSKDQRGISADLHTVLGQTQTLYTGHTVIDVHYASISYPACGTLSARSSA